MKETDFYQKHVKKMSGILHLERIESSIGSGFPDVCAAGKGKQFLIETKVSKLSEGRDMLYFERFQLAFYQKRMRYTEGKGVFVLALCNENTDIKLWKADSVVDAPREPYKKWNRVAIDGISEPLFEGRKPWNRLCLELFAKAMLENS